jgi:hypothetical protein
MDCKETEKVIEGLFEEDTGDDVRRRLESHLAACKACREEYDRVRQLLESVRTIPVPDPGEPYWSDFLPRLREKIEQAGSRRSTFIFPLRRILVVGSIISLLVVVLGISFWVSREKTLRPPTNSISWETIDRKIGDVKSEEELSALQAFADPDVIDLSNGGTVSIPAISEDVFFGTAGTDALDFENGLDTLTPQEKKELIEVLRGELG